MTVALPRFRAAPSPLPFVTRFLPRVCCACCCPLPSIDTPPPTRLLAFNVDVDAAEDADDDDDDDNNDDDDGEEADNVSLPDVDDLPGLFDSLLEEEENLFDVDADDEGADNDDEEEVEEEDDEGNVLW